MSRNSVQQSVSEEIWGAIKEATPKAVHPKDEFEEDGPGVRIAGWDPDEKQSNEVLLRKCGAYLTSRGWRVTPEVTDSEDRSALIAKAGLASGRLYASNQGLTFTGTLDG